MRPIPPKLRNELAEEPRMKHCLLLGAKPIYGGCTGGVEWDHVWIYAGKQINEKWAIVGVCKGHHAAKEGNWMVKEAIQTASLKLATADDLGKYPRKDWQQIKRSLGIINHSQTKK